MPRGHPDEVKARAREVYIERGPGAAAQATGVSERTVRDWARKDNWVRNLNAATAAEAAQQHLAATMMGWQARRRRLGDEAGQAASEVLAQLRQRSQVGKVYGIESLARAFDFLARQADALTAGTGGEGSRDMPQSERVARLRTHLDTWKDRAKAAGDDA